MFRYRKRALRAEEAARMMGRALRIIPEVKWTIFYLHNGSVQAKLTTSRAIFKATRSDEIAARLACLEQYDARDI